MAFYFLLSVFGYPILAVASFALSIYFIFTSRKDLRLGAITSAAVFILVTWPFLVGRLLFEVQCWTASGLSVRKIVDASTTGYYLYDHKTQPYMSGRSTDHPYFAQAIQDLIDGRIAYFETTSGYTKRELESIREMKETEAKVQYGSMYELLPAPYAYKKFYLAAVGNKNCAVGPLGRGAPYPPQDRCIAHQLVENLGSKYEVRGYDEEQRTYVTVYERDTWFGYLFPIASRRVFILPRKRGLYLSARTLYCPGPHETALWTTPPITAIVFPDSHGKTAAAANLD